MKNLVYAECRRQRRFVFFWLETTREHLLAFADRDGEFYAGSAWDPARVFCGPTAEVI
jgi:hypothetical protein